MRHDDYAEHVIDFTDEMRKVTSDKNHDYSVRDDAMDNFKLIGEALGCSPRLVWSVLWMKHVTAVINHMAKGKTLRSETIHGRFIDLANYALLGDALDKDLAAEVSSPEKPNPDRLIVLELWEAFRQVNDDLSRACSAYDHVTVRERANKAKEYIHLILENLEKHYRDQHGSSQSVVPVHGHPRDVQDSPSNQRADGESDAGPNTPPHPAYVPQRPANSGDDELRRDRPKPKLKTDPNQVPSP